MYLKLKIAILIYRKLVHVSVSQSIFDNLNVIDE